jgi:hypothetical protein
MGIPELAILVAGMTLAHAAWIVADLRAGELLAPVAITQREGEPFQLQAFEAETQEEAIANGKAAMGRLRGGDQAWALVREGLWPEGNQKVDVLVLDFWGPGMEEPVTLLQRFRPAASPQGFQLLGNPQVSIGGRLQPDTAMAPLIAVLEDGIRQHVKASALWDGWHSPP